MNPDALHIQDVALARDEGGRYRHSETTQIWRAYVFYLPVKTKIFAA